MKAFTLLTLSIVLFACHELQVDSDLQAIIRDEGIFPIDEVFADLDPIMQQKVQAVGQMNGMCTAFHLGEGIVVSAAHCFVRELKPTEPCISTDLRWHDGSRSQCVQILSYEWTDERDMVVFEVDPAPKTQLSWAKDIFTHNEAVVVGYPHQRPLSISHPCELKGLTRIANRFFHDCDTLPGNSGSPVIDPSSGAVIGIHNGFLEQLNYATLLVDWEQIEGEVKQIQYQRQSEAEQLVFGPFGNLENRLLYHFPFAEDQWVSFTIQYDVEDGYDFVNIRDGRGIRIRLTGRDSRHFELETPVVVSFESDYSGPSDYVEIIPDA